MASYKIPSLLPVKKNAACVYDSQQNRSENFFEYCRNGTEAFMSLTSLRSEAIDFM
jgi:hypothetical protein